ncbi:MAG: filamentous hemagglutinin N-terminal domain-containing protein [Cyanobacteria bacterium J06638_28]
MSGSLLFTAPGIAQLIPDNSLGAESSLINPNGLIQGLPTDLVEGGASRGSNLFHSFTEFNVNTGQRVYFANPIGIENILTRVTGGNLSNIDGLLGVDGAANLFLLNPNGVIFGPNARLDVSGSFTTSTAGSFAFADGSEFSATPTGNDLLTVSVPLGVQFNDQSQGNITNQGELTVGAGESLTLFGDTVLSEDSLTAAGGIVQVLGNRVALTDSAMIDVSNATGDGTVLIGGDYQGNGTVPNADLTFVGADVRINADATAVGDGGRVVVWADEATRFLGSITARGGLQGGNGGWVEVSGRQNLDFQGDVDTSASLGRDGTLLLDPDAIQVQAGTLLPPNAADGLWAFGEDPGTQTIGAQTIVDLLATNALTLQATDEIVVLSEITSTSDNNLTLEAPSIFVFGAVASGGDLTLLGTDESFTAGALSAGQDLTIQANGIGGSVRMPTPVALTAGANLTIQANGSSGLVRFDPAGDLQAGGDLVIQANGAGGIVNIVLAGNLQSARDLTIEADDVSITPINPVSGVSSIQAGRTLTVQGTNSLAISFTGLYSGRNLVLRSNEPSILSDTPLYSGGDITIAQVTNSEVPSDLFDPNSFPNSSAQAMFAAGNVTLGDYEGSGLNILAGGNVEMGSFDVFDRPSDSLIDSNNTDTFNGQITYAELAQVTVNSYTLSAANQDGIGVLTPSSVERTISLSTLPTLDIRAGIDWGQLGGVPTSPTTVTTSPSATNVGSNVTIKGDISSNGASSAATFITNNFRPNLSLPDGTISTQDIDLIRENNDLNSGLDIYSRGNIVVGGSIASIDTSSGDSGTINVFAERGGVEFQAGTNIISSSAFDTSQTVNIIAGEGNIIAPNLNVAAGEPVAFYARAGDIKFPGVNISTGGRSGTDIYVLAEQGSVLAEGTSFSLGAFDSSGGDIYLSSGQSIEFEDSPVFSTAGTGGIIPEPILPGSIFFTTIDGNVSLTNTSLESVGEDTGSGASSGFISLYTEQGDIELENSRVSIESTIGLTIFAMDDAEPDILLSAQAGSIRGSNTTITAQTDGGGVDDDNGIPLNGPAGNILIEAQDEVSGLTIEASADADDSGDISIIGSNNTLKLTDIALSTSSTVFDNNPPFASSSIPVFNGPQAGDAGDVTIISAGNLSLNRVAINSTTDTPGNAGTVTISSPGEITFQDTRIQTNTTGQNFTQTPINNPGEARGGSIVVEHGTVVALDKTQLETNTSGDGQAGSILVRDVDALVMRNSSLLLANAEGNQTNGGDVTIAANFVIAPPNENNDILVTAVGGDGGIVTIDANTILGFTQSSEPDPNILRASSLNEISASSQSGTEGAINLNTLDVDPASGLTELPTNLSDRTNQITTGCGVGNTDTGGEFVITGTGGLPPGPDNVSTSDRILVPWVSDEADSPESGVNGADGGNRSGGGDRLVEAQGLVLDTDGNAHLVENIATANTQPSGLPASQLCAAKMQQDG